MNKRKIYNFIIFIPFAIALGSFVLYFKYLFTIKASDTLKVTELMEVSLVRYRNIGIFCLALGVFLLFIKTIWDYFRIDDDIALRNERVLDKISSKKIDEDEYKYSFNENNIINDLLGGKTLKAIFHSDDIEEKNIRFKNYDSDKNVIEFYDLSNKSKNIVKTETKKETKVVSTPIINVIKDDIDFNSNDFKKCHKCKNIVAKDAIMCVHCGTNFKQVKEEKSRTNSFNPIRFALNLITILLCIILVLLCFSKIFGQSKLNRNNLNINNIKTVEVR